MVAQQQQSQSNQHCGPLSQEEPCSIATTAVVPPCEHNKPVLPSPLFYNQCMAEIKHCAPANSNALCAWQQYCIVDMATVRRQLHGLFYCSVHHPYTPAALCGHFRSSASQHGDVYALQEVPLARNALCIKSLTHLTCTATPCFCPPGFSSKAVTHVGREDVQLHNSTHAQLVTKLAGGYGYPQMQIAT